MDAFSLNSFEIADDSVEVSENASISIEIGDDSQESIPPNGQAEDGVDSEQLRNLRHRQPSQNSEQALAGLERLGNDAMGRMRFSVIKFGPVFDVHYPAIRSVVTSEPGQDDSVYSRKSRVLECETEPQIKKCESKVQWKDKYHVNTRPTTNIWHHFASFVEHENTEETGTRSKDMNNWKESMRFYFVCTSFAWFILISDPPSSPFPTAIESSGTSSLAIEVGISIYDFVSIAFSGTMCIQWIFGENDVFIGVVGVSIYTALIARAKMEHMAATAVVVIQIVVGLVATMLNWRQMSRQRIVIQRQAGILGWILSMACFAMMALSKYGYILRHSNHPSIITEIVDGCILAAYVLINVGIAIECSNIGDEHIRFGAGEPLFQVTTTNLLFILAIIDITYAAAQL